MDMSRRFFLIALCVVVAGLTVLRPRPAEAHKLNIFAWPVGEVIYGEAVFSGGRKAKNVKITVQDVQSHTILLETHSDNQGEFNFALPEQAAKKQLDLLIVADSGDGHRGEWLLTATEYFARSATSDLLSGPVVAQAKTGLIAEQAVRRIVQEELNRELAPVKQALAEGREKKIDPRDIAGGIGCILGIAGLFAWIQTKKKKNTKAVDG
jgi:nickel transport protein